MAKYLCDTKNSLISFTIDGKDIILSHGKTYDFSEENDYIRSLVDNGYLSVVAEPVANSKPNRSNPKTT